MLLRCLPLKNLVKSEFVTLWPWVYLSVPAWCAVLLWSNVNTSLPPHPTLPRKKYPKVVCSFLEKGFYQKIQVCRLLFSLKSVKSGCPTLVSGGVSGPFLCCGMRHWAAVSCNKPCSVLEHKLSVYRRKVVVFSYSNAV